MQTCYYRQGIKEISHITPEKSYVRSVSAQAVMSSEARRHFIANFMMK